MKPSFSERVERARITTGQFASSRGHCFGAFIPHTNAGVPLKVIASDGSDDVPWEHVSVSTKGRCPSWEEMAWVKSLFWNDDECVVQFHPPKSEYVNFHPYCLHLWKPLGVTIPTPPKLAVGPQTAQPLEVSDG